MRFYFLLSGEGATDIGVGRGEAVVCEGADFLFGPMALIVDHIVRQCHHYSLLDAQCCGCGYVSEHHLEHRGSELKTNRKSLLLSGPKRPKETGYFFKHARILARIARERQIESKDEVIAVLFHDSDGTASAGRGLWDDKHNSIANGFQEEGFTKGVPMVAKPKSEAWLISGITGSRNHDGRALEDWSGNDKSPNSLKKALEKLTGQKSTRESLCDLIRDGTCDCEKIDLPKFKTFRDRLQAVLS
jgi:hypothetical protein